jgi:hypothetical protein
VRLNLMLFVVSNRCSEKLWSVEPKGSGGMLFLGSLSFDALKLATKRCLWCCDFCNVEAQLLRVIFGCIFLGPD